MRRCHTYIYIVIGLALLGASACNRSVEPETDGQPEILLAAEDYGTKALLNRGDLSVNGTKFQTYDYLSGYNGTISGHTNGEEFQYFGSELTYKSDASWKWVFGDPAAPTTYRWTRTGVHHFFGWMLADGHDATNLSTSSFFDTYTVGTKTVTLAKNDLKVSNYQYDFLYSDVVSVDVLEDGIPSSVELPMKHLFGAIGITVSNSSTQDITVNWVRLKNFPGHCKATLTYNMSSGVSVAYDDLWAQGAYNYWDNQIQRSFTLPDRDDPQGGKIYDCFTGEEIPSGGTPQFRISWPMDPSVLEPIISGYDEVDQTPIYDVNSPLIEVNYSADGGSAGTVAFPFPSMQGATASITAGKKTQINLSFADKQILLYYKVLPWDYKEYPMSFEDSAISATQLKFTENTFVSLPKVTDASGRHDVIQLTSSSTEGPYIAKGTFKAYTPVNARLVVTLGGNGEDFEVSLDSGETSTGGNSSITIDPQRDGGLISLRIKPKGTPKSGSKCYLHFSVLNGSRESDADTEINRDNYMIVIP